MRRLRRDRLEAGSKHQLGVGLGRITREVHRDTEPLALPVPFVGRSERGKEHATRPQPSVDPSEQRRQELAGNVVQDVERADSVKRGNGEFEPTRSPCRNSRRGARARAPQLFRRQVDAGQAKLRASSRVSAVPLPQPSSSTPPRREVARSARPATLRGDRSDRRRPGLPRVGHRVVAGADECGPRIAHSTSTSSRLAAASARSRASRFVLAVAIT